MDKGEAQIIGSGSVFGGCPYTERTFQGQECLLLLWNAFRLQDYVDSVPLPLALQVEGQTGRDGRASKAIRSLCQPLPSGSHTPGSLFGGAGIENGMVG